MSLAHAEGQQPLQGNILRKRNILYSQNEAHSYLIRNSQPNSF